MTCASRGLKNSQRSAFLTEWESGWSWDYIANMAERVQFVLPRQIVKWIDSLDLSYQVRNPRKDLATGYLVAEILTRYYPKELSIYSFHNAQGREKRHNNWDRIQQFLKRKEFDLTSEEYLAISNMAPKTALAVLVRLYEFFTRKKYVERSAEKDSPEEGYARPTVASLTKDREIDRIVDDNRKKKELSLTITQHRQRMDEEKQSSGLVEWLIKKRRTMVEKEIKAQEDELAHKSRLNSNDLVAEVKEIQLKCFNSSTSKKPKNELGEIYENKGVVDFLQESCLGLLKKEPLNKEIKRLGLDLKERDGSPKSVLAELFKQCGRRDGKGIKKISNQSIKTLLNQFLQPSEISLIVDNIEANFLDFRKLFSMLLLPLRALKPTSKTLQLLKQLFREIADQLVRNDHESAM
jgi:hypothetical protein